MRTERHPMLATLVLVLAVVLAACGGGGTPGGDGPLSWRDLDLVVPDGWEVLDQRDDLLFLANEDIRLPDDQDAPSPPADPDAVDVVGAQLSGGTTTSAEEWRALVEQEGGELEADESITVGGLPATSLTYLWRSNGVPSRERVVFVPSRELYIVLQPIPVRGQTTGPEVFDAHVGEFDALVSSIEFGRPFDG